MKYRWWAILIRFLSVPIWYPFAILAWAGEKSEIIFWWISSKLPRPYK